LVLFGSRSATMLARNILTICCGSVDLFPNAEGGRKAEFYYYSSPS
jgi:hypothetical protein